jgi:hypothetical protein
MRGKAGMLSRRQPAPNDISGITAWWDASDAARLFNATTGGSLVAADGAVARFEDKTANGRHLTMVTSENRPIRKTAVQNGLDVLRFDGSNDRMATSSLFSSFFSASAFTLFIVAKATSISTNNANIWQNAAVVSDGGNSHGFFAVRSNSTAAAFAFNSTSGTATSSAAYTAGDWVVFSVLHNGASLTARINGTDATSASIASLSFMSFTLNLGVNGGFDAYFNGDVGEVVTYNTTLSANDRNSIESYLRNKWAI